MDVMEGGFRCEVSGLCCEQLGNWQGWCRNGRVCRARSGVLHDRRLPFALRPLLLRLSSVASARLGARSYASGELNWTRCGRGFTVATFHFLKRFAVHSIAVDATHFWGQTTSRWLLVVVWRGG